MRMVEPLRQRLLTGVGIAVRSRYRAWLEGSDRPETPGSRPEHLIVDAGPSLYPQMPAGIQM